MCENLISTARALATVVAIAAVAPAVAQFRVNAIALDTAPGNVAVTRAGRIFITAHQMFEPAVRVLEVDRFNRATSPYPNAAWAGPADGNGVGLDSPLGIRAAQDSDRLYILDNANRTESAVPKLVIWDTAEERLDRVIYIPRDPAAPSRSFHNDLALDPRERFAITADFGNPSLGVIDLTTGVTRVVLAGHPSVLPEPDAEMIIDGREVTMNGKPARIGVNPITIDHDGLFVYYGAMHGTRLYRVRLADLTNDALTPEQIAARVENWSAKPVSDGITMGSFNEVLVTDLVAGTIGVAFRESYYLLSIVAPDDTGRFSWPDAICGAPDGSFYFVTNQLHRSAPLNGGVNEATPPFYLYHLRSDGDRYDRRGKVGR